MNINFEYYKIFYHVAKASSISAAARELCISQPAVSQAIKALEQAIGIELFIRTKKGVSLTNAGELLYSHDAAGSESISLGEQQLSQLLHMETGEIRIGASDMTLQFYLLPYLEHFHQLYPGIKVHVTNAPTPSTINHLLSGNIDFGIVTSPLPADPHMEIRQAREIEDTFIAPIGSYNRSYHNTFPRFRSILKYFLISVLWLFKCFCLYIIFISRSLTIPFHYNTIMS